MTFYCSACRVLNVMNNRSFLIFGCAMMLSSCVSWSQDPAPISTYGQKSGAGSAGVHTIAPGDTLYTVAQNYNLPMRDIVHVNNIQPPFRLVVGQRLRLPPPQEYRARAGDTVYSVALMFGVNPSEVARLNDLRTPYALREGQMLRLPSVTRKSSIAKRAQSAPVVSVEREVLEPPVQASSSPPSPAQKPEAIAQDSTPAVDDSRKSNDFLRQPPQETATQKVAQTQDLASQPKQSASAPAAKSQPKPLQMVNDIPRRASSKFMRPVEGDIILDYGPKSNGQHNDGINIKAAKGTPVKAAENGVVVYAGNALKGSGNLVLVRHEDQWITAYAHMQDIKVAKGDIVRRGEAVGSVGATGSVSSPQLHFEVRRGTEAINPKNYLE